MRAQVQHGFGGPEVCTIEHLADPVPGAGEVVVDVRACALNRLDLLQRAAPLVRGFALPHVAGMDVVGVVSDRHPDLDPSSGPELGTLVVIDPVSTCGVCTRCRSGLGPYCQELRTVGSTRQGGFAERVAVPASSCFAVPDDLTVVEAAALPVAAMTAWHALVRVGAVAAGETVLVNGASSGVSLAAMQLAKGRGATVITTAAGSAKVQRALAAGYDVALDRNALDRDDCDDGGLARRVLEVTDGRGVDLVIDHVGPAQFQASIDALAMEGRMVFCGTTTGTETHVDLTSVYWWGRRLLGAGGYQRDEFQPMLDEFGALAAGGGASGGVRPVIDSVWPFDELPAAQAAMEAGAFFGKLVVSFGGA